MKLLMLSDTEKLNVHTFKNTFSSIKIDLPYVLNGFKQLKSIIKKSFISAHTKNDSHFAFLIYCRLSDKKTYGQLPKTVTPK